VIAVLAVVLIAGVAAYIVLPFFRRTEGDRADASPVRDELWKHEKAVAVLAITEADFDLATGKLSDDDYHVLRSDYEGRALHAMDEIDRLAPSGAATTANFCAGCGARFTDTDSFCGACGRPRFDRE
jgi:hypothetical protein